MLCEEEVKYIIEREKMFLECMVDPDDIRCQRAFIAGLELVLND